MEVENAEAMLIRGVWTIRGRAVCERTRGEGRAVAASEPAATLLSGTRLIMFEGNISISQHLQVAGNFFPQRLKLLVISKVVLELNDRDFDLETLSDGSGLAISTMTSKLSSVSDLTSQELVCSVFMAALQCEMICKVNRNTLLQASMMIGESPPLRYPTTEAYLTYPLPSFASQVAWSRHNLTA